jgi:hypothetical protein
MKLLVVIIAKVTKIEEGSSSKTLRMFARPSQWLTLATIFISHNLNHLTIAKINNQVDAGKF